jgi:hypothetical protein
MFLYRSSHFPISSRERLQRFVIEMGIFQQAQKVVCSFSASRSHAPAWECIPYVDPHAGAWEPGISTFQFQVSSRSRLQRFLIEMYLERPERSVFSGCFEFFSILGNFYNRRPFKALIFINIRLVSVLSQFVLYYLVKNIAF